MSVSRRLHFPTPVLRACALLALLLALLLAAVPAWAGAQLQGIALSGDGAPGARLTLELSAPVKRKVFTLAHPARIVIDLPGTRLAPGVKMPGGQGVVHSVRLGSQPGQTLRLVLQLNATVPVRSDYASGGRGGRLVIAMGRPLRSATAARTAIVKNCGADVSALPP